MHHKNTENCKASNHLFAFLCGFVSFLDSIVLSCVFNWKMKHLKAGGYWDEMAVFFLVRSLRVSEHLSDCFYYECTTSNAPGHLEHSETNRIKNKTDRFSVVHPLMCGTGDLWGTDAVFLLDFRGPTCQDREATKDLLEDVTCANGRYSSLYSLNGLFSAFTSYDKLYFLSGKCNKVKNNSNNNDVTIINTVILQ